MNVTQDLLVLLRTTIKDRGSNPSNYRIAKVLGVTQQSVGNWTKGRGGMANDTIVKTMQFIDPNGPPATVEYWLCRRAAELETDEQTRGVWEYMAKHAYGAARASTVLLVAHIVYILCQIRERGRRFRNDSHSVVAAAILLSITTGCASIPPEEIAWQTAHLVDGLQTYHGPASDPCFVEGDPLTRSVIGESPSKSDVAGYFATTAALHYLASRWFEQTDLVSAKWKHAVRGLDFALKVYVVTDNHQEGIRVAGDNHPQHGVCAK